MNARPASLATILALLFSVTLFAEPKAAPGEQPSAIVLCYHIVGDRPASRMEISRETFRQHLRYLEMTGYNVIPLRHLYEFMSGKRATLPKNAIVITIDDGWRSTYTEAFPELQKRKFPFTVFVYPNIIGKTAAALSWKQIKEMSDAGVDIQSHSLTHPYLTKRRHRRFGDGEYEQWLQRELAESRRILEQQTGRKVQFLAYPYGDYDDRVAVTASKAGYTAALTCDFGAVRRGHDPLKMRRVVIDSRMDFAAFRHYLGTRPMMLAEMTPSPKGPVDPGVTTISARIPDFRNLDPKSVGMAILSAGRAIPYSYDARNGLVSVTLRESLTKLQAQAHRAIVWGVDRKTGKRVEASWVLSVASPAKPKPVTTVPQPPQAAPAPAPAVTAAGMLGVGGGGSPKK